MQRILGRQQRICRLAQTVIDSSVLGVQTLVGEQVIHRLVRWQRLGAVDQIFVALVALRLNAQTGNYGTDKQYMSFHTIRD